MSILLANQPNNRNNAMNDADQAGHSFSGRFPFITIGIVRSTSDPDQLGRLQVFCPTIDNESCKQESLPWARYVSPFGGEIKNLAVGPDHKKIPGVSTYGFWAIPKVGSQVLVFFVDGDPTMRCWFSQIHPQHLSHGLPHGMNKDNSGKTLGRWSEDDISNTVDKQQATESGLVMGDWFLTRGPYERQVGVSKEQLLEQKKRGEDGYAPNPNNAAILDPQAYCWTTPGQHFFLMSDAPDTCRIRMRSTTGHQVIMDDTNERIYISTNTGKSWIEIDSNGHMMIFSEDSISYHTKEDFNITADNSINFHTPTFNVHASVVDPKRSATDPNVTKYPQAGKIQMYATCCINTYTDGDTNMYSKNDTHIKSDADFHSTAGATTNIKSGGNIRETAAQIHLNSEAAVPADQALVASKPSLVPQKEPWVRPKGKKTRNAYWKP